MNSDPATLILWIRGCLWIAALCTTAFPLLYLFSAWQGSKLGRVVMLQAVAFALAMDVTLLFQYWTPSSPMVIFWINAFVLSLIAVASASLTVMMWVSNYKLRKRIKEVLHG